MSEIKPSSLQWFPQRRLDEDFPLAFWFAGLWFYLKGFLYLCYLYMLGLEPPPYSDSVKFEIIYFAVAMIPCVLLGLAMWNEKRGYTWVAILFLVIDTPILFAHVMRLWEEGYLDAGLTGVLEIGSLVLNVIAFAWLLSSYSRLRAEPVKKPVR
jgi:hypothetical protein